MNLTHSQFIYSYISVVNTPKYAFTCLLLVYAFLPACSNDSSQEAADVSQNHTTSHIIHALQTKTHGCVKAWFDTNPYVDFALRYGIFRKPGQRYEAWVRYSSGYFHQSAMNDQEKGVRSMAIKILGPPVEPVRFAADDIPTQDFLMWDSPVFFLRNYEDYDDFVVRQSFPAFIFNGWNPFNWRLKAYLLSRRVMTPPPPSLLSPQYYSVTAYSYGPYNIKFSTRPCVGEDISIGPERSSPDYLRHNLQQALEVGEACFDFLVQVQNPDMNMPVDDLTVEWKETDSPFIPVARLIIHSRIFDTEEQMQFCESLSFDPWHTLPDMLPIDP